MTSGMNLLFAIKAETTKPGKDKFIWEVKGWQVRVLSCGLVDGFMFGLINS